MLILSMLVFAFAVSIDGFGVGFAYGMKNIVIPIRSLLVICLTSSTAIAISMFLGKFVILFISLEVAQLICAIILSCMGLFMLIHTWLQKKQEDILLGEEGMLVRFRIPCLGILIQILKEPAKADVDHSCIIDLRESFILGFALAMDALGAGFAVAVAGFPPIWTALAVGISKFMLVSAGVKLGQLSATNRLVQKSAFVPGLLLLILGLSKLK